MRVYRAYVIRHAKTSYALFQSILLMVFFIFFFTVYFLRERETERQRVSGGGAERKGDTESEAGSRLRAVSTEPDTSLEP